MEEIKNPENPVPDNEPSPETPVAELKIVSSLPGFSPQSLPDDKFSKGRIVKYFPQSRYGFIKDKRGKDVYFNVDEIRFVGDKGRESLKEGILVGYDVAWTPHGLHIAYIKIY